MGDAQYQRPQLQSNVARYGLGGRVSLIRVGRALPLVGIKDELFLISKPGDAAHGELYWYDDATKTWTLLATPSGGHAEAHVLATTGPHTSTLPWADLNKTGSSLADLATRTHASLSDAPADAHHAEAHSHAGVVESVNFIIDGGGSAITTGIKGDIVVDFAGTIQSVTMLGDQTGSVVVDIWKDTYTNFPPTNADSITASAVPTISTAIKSQDATLTGWTTSITAGDILRFNVDSVTDIERVTLVLKVLRT